MSSHKLKRYKNSMDLGDGSVLEILYTEESGYADPAECNSEVYFRIDGVAFDREDLPDEVTAEVIAELIDSAQRCEDGSSDPDV